jgi:polyhydroxybutyrate depolymerase
MRMLMSLVPVALMALAGCAELLDLDDSELEGTLHEDQTFEFGGETRTYHFYEPDSSGEPLPLVLLLHGGGAEIDDHIGLGFVDWPHEIWLDIADEDGLYVLVPQGLDSQWNDCRSDCPHCGEQDDVGFLLALLDELAGRHAIDSDRVYVVGESNGGFMTQRLGIEAPDRFTGLGVVIALMPANDECTAAGDEPLPIMFQIGTADATIPYEGGVGVLANTGEVLSAADSVAYWVLRDQCHQTPTPQALPDLDPDDDSTVTRDDFDCPATATAVTVLTLHGAGHVAPSIEVQVSGLWESIAGEQNHDIEGAREFWTFFQETTGP